MVVAWQEFKDSPEYEALKRSLENPNAVDAALWSVFESGWVSRRVVIHEFLTMSKEDRAATMMALGEQQLSWWQRILRSWKGCKE